MTDVTKEEAERALERLHEAERGAWDLLLNRIRAQDDAQAALDEARRAAGRAALATHDAAAEWARAREVYVRHGGNEPIGGVQ